MKGGSHGKACVRELTHAQSMMIVSNSKWGHGEIFIMTMMISSEILTMSGKSRHPGFISLPRARKNKNPGKTRTLPQRHVHLT